MDRENHSEITQTVITKGPFIIRLGVGGEKGAPRTSGRWILGGSDDAENMLSQALSDIGNLPDGLDWRQLQQKASLIFKTRGLSRIDY